MHPNNCMHIASPPTYVFRESLFYALIQILWSFWCQTAWRATTAQNTEIRRTSAERRRCVDGFTLRLETFIVSRGWRPTRFSPADWYLSFRVTKLENCHSHRSADWYSASYNTSLFIIPLKSSNILGIITQNKQKWRKKRKIFVLLQPTGQPDVWGHLETFPSISVSSKMFFF